ncbi:MAG: YggT family protein [Spirochaetaceae bacterium]|jgi:YggT family protein|nr:YggT family protein [Spirochaetaceae bacterium]
MPVVFSLLSVFSFLISLYTLICFARIIITWFPAARNSRPGVALGKICDPYLGLFRRFSLFRRGSLDFTPVIAIGVLVILSSICANIVAAGRISLGVVTGTVVAMIWVTAAAFFNIILLVMAVRLIFDLINQDGGSRAWAAFDSFLNPLVFSLTGFFFGNRYRSYRTSLITAIIVLLLIRIAGELAVGFIAGLLFRLPF